MWLFNWVNEHNLNKGIPEVVGEILQKNLPFIETLDWFNPQTEKQEKALQSIKGLVSLVEKFNAAPPKPIMFTLYWKPWTWKTHLLKWFINEIAKRNIKYDFIANPWVMLSVNNSNIYVIDDLYACTQDLNKLSSFDYERLENVIFDIYGKRKILVFTSNFSLSEMVNFIKKHDKQGRITSRINEFIWICPDLEIDWDDYREKVWQETQDIFWEFFS